MRLTKVLSAFILALAASAAIAHAHLQKAVPANGAVVNASPTSVVLTFSEAAKLTACWLQKGDGPKQKIGAVAASAAREISVPMPQLQPGLYVLSWRAVGDDGHVVPGQLQFTIAAPSTTAAQSPH
jgi:methionine-rich copper-binding protein CopC